VKLTELRRDDVNVTDWRERRAVELELELLRRLDPAEADRMEGKAPTARAAGDDPWSPFRHLVGTWTAEGPDAVHWTFDFIGGGQFLEVRGSSVLGPRVSRPGGEPEMGRISRDPAKGFTWRQFTAGGQVDQYVLERSSGGALTFTSSALESQPPGSRARFILGEAGPDEILAIFEIAEPGKDFAVSAESRLHRSR
jgi:hypothetical protein